MTWDKAGEIKRRALTPALVTIRCGCFLPDLTRFTGLPCGEARQRHCTLLFVERFLDSPGLDGNRQFSQQGLGIFPTEAGIGDRLAVGQGLAGT
jgi:hypothetical protein